MTLGAQAVQGNAQSKEKTPASASTKPGMNGHILHTGSLPVFPLFHISIFVKLLTSLQDAFRCMVETDQETLMG